MNSKTDLISGLGNAKLSIKIFMNNRNNFYVFQLSVVNNRLIRMFQVGKLHHLKVLDLSNNNIVTIEGLKVHFPLILCHGLNIMSWSLILLL